MLRHPWDGQEASCTQQAAAGATERSTHAATDSASNSSSCKVSRGSSAQAACGMLMWSSGQRHTAAESNYAGRAGCRGMRRAVALCATCSKAPRACLSLHSEGCPRSRQSGCPCRSWLLLRLRRCLLPPWGSSCCSGRPLPGPARSARRPVERSRLWRLCSRLPDLQCTEPLEVWMGAYQAQPLRAQGVTARPALHGPPESKAGCLPDTCADSQRELGPTELSRVPARPALHNVLPCPSPLSTGPGCSGRQSTAVLEATSLDQVQHASHSCCTARQLSRVKEVCGVSPALPAPAAAPVPRLRTLACLSLHKQHTCI